MAHPDLDNRKSASGYNNSGSYNVMMGKPQPAHLGSQSSSPGKEDESNSGYRDYIDSEVSRISND